MTAEKILQSDILDILFEDRNKLYGAYELRRTYHRRLKQGIGGMILAIALLTGGYYVNFGKQNNIIAGLDVNDTTVMIMVQDPPTPPKPEPPPPPTPPPPPQATIAYTAPLLVADLPKTEMPPQTDIDTAAISTVIQTGAPSTDAVVPETKGGTPGGDGLSKEMPVTAVPNIPSGPVDMGKVDQMPEYPGGSRALINYMVRNLTSELEPGVKYVVKAQFVINEEGAVSDATILYSDDEVFNNQVLKAIRKMARWKPGMLHGQKVAVRFTMPVTFVGPED